MCRTYENAETGPYVRLCYRKGAHKGARMKGRLGETVPATPRGCVYLGNGMRAPRRPAEAPGWLCHACERLAWPGDEYPICRRCR